MDLAAIAAITAVVVAYSLVSARLAAVSVTGPIVFVAAGAVFGPQVLDVIGGGFEEGAVEVLAEATLVLLLFTDATRIDLRVLRRDPTLPGRLLGIGLPLTVVLGAAMAALVFPELGAWEAALLAAILAPTDAALGQAVVSNERVPVRIRQALNVESGLNDGLILPAITILLALAATEVDLESPSYWVLFVLRQIGFGLLFGVLIGGLGGRLLDYCVDRRWVEGTFRQLGTIATGVGAFAAAELAGGNGFVAAFIAGSAFGFVAHEHCETALDFTEDEGALFSLLTFLFFGALLVGPRLDELTLEIGVYVLLSLTVIRMVPVALGMIAVGLERPSVLFLGWFGPRGLASIVFVIVVIEEASLPGEELILTVVTWTVAASVLLHGLTSVPFARMYAAWFGRMPDASEMPEGQETETMPLRLGGMGTVRRRP